MTLPFSNLLSGILSSHIVTSIFVIIVTHSVAIKVAAYGKTD